MSGCVNQIKDIGFTFILVFHTYSMALNSYTTLPFQVHIIQYLIHKLILANSTCALQ